ncbi:MAG: tyrosine--tRNA ligase [Candidatus Peribacteraceae bacterium]|nr:tyrosine--tRNA ligase [Candidatus Peribacteraceae bacterium]
MPSDLLTRAVEKAIPAKLAEEKLKSGKTLRLYWGIDPTGAKIHLGHAVPLRKMREFVEAGHEVIFLVGSFTAMIGDPTGRDAMREPLTREKIEENFATYKEQASKILDFSKVQVRYNHEWLETLKFDDIVKLAANFTVQQMMERDMFEKRWEGGKPIGLHEFFYPLMVGYDSVILDVDVELGGSDQEFNMLAGRTLQQAFGKRDKFVLTTKLLLGTDGRKMSKTYDNCIYLEDAPGDMYGKVMSVKDELIVPYFECCTDVDSAELKAIAKELEKGSGNPRDAKKRLAREIVTLYHGAEAAAKADEQFAAVFAGGGVPDDVAEVEVKKGTALIETLVGEKLVASKSEARRLIEQGGVHLNNKVVQSMEAEVESGIVKVGKRRFLKLIVR